MSKYYKVYDECFKVNENDGFCFHYILYEHMYDYPIISYCVHENGVIRRASKNDFKQDEKICSNPFGYIPEDMAVKIRESRPKVPEQPMSDCNQIITKINVKTQNEILDFMKNKIYADCHCIYTRDSDNLETIKVYSEANTNDDRENLDDKTLLNMWDSDKPVDVVLVMNVSLANYVIQRIESSWLFGKTYKYIVSESRIESTNE